MSDSEMFQKILRSVLQSSKDGVLLSRLQHECKLLCGEGIPFVKLGYPNLEKYVRSIPSVVRLEYRMGELRCFATVCKETAHIAELVAKQKRSKKARLSHLVAVRGKYSDHCMFDGKPRSSLRQPSYFGASNWMGNRSRTHDSSRYSGDYRQLDRALSSITPVEHRVPPALKESVLPKRREASFANGSNQRENPPEDISSIHNWPESSQYNVALAQSRVTKLLEKYCSGLWMSKLPQVYSREFEQLELPPQVLKDIDKWTHICTVEKPSGTFKADHLIYPPLPAAAMPRSPSPSSALAPPTPVSVGGDYNVGGTSPSGTLNRKQKVKPLGPTWTSPASTDAPSLASSYNPDNFNLLTMTCSSSSNSVHGPPPRPSPLVVPAEVRRRVKDLLSKYSHGVWVNALPKLYMDTYKTALPEYILDNVSLLPDICKVEYVTTRDKTKAILYYTGQENMEVTGGHGDQQCSRSRLPSGLEVVSPVVPPCLVLPTEQYPSVLVTDATSSNTVTVRYVGENYSNTQEAMEDRMLSFYNQHPTIRPISKPAVGQLVAVRDSDGDDMARGQVMEVPGPKNVKVYYVDHGFSVTTAGTNLLELHKDFLSLPFQAMTVRLAGLDAFGSHPLLLSSLENLAVGKVLLMETIKSSEKKETPVVVLYDTSQDDDIIINTACLMTLQDKTMNNPLAVNATYSEVAVTNVFPDGIICCQLPSRGAARLRKLLERTEAVFMSQTTSEFLVSRPFTGKFCLAQYKAKWARVEITKMHGNRVMELLFIDFGIPATVEVTDLREFPPGLLKDFIVIPPQATKCRLVDLRDSERDWSPDISVWLKGNILGRECCTIKIMKLEQHKDERLVYIYLFVGADSKEQHKSINHQLARSTLWNNNNTIRHHASMDAVESAVMKNLSLDSPVPQPTKSTPTQQYPDSISKFGVQPLPMPPPLKLPPPGQNMDVFVSSACHPGNFVLQQWQEMHKLVVLMGEMILYYNRTWVTNTTLHIEKGEVYAARIDNNWHRVEVRKILAHGLVSVYELDYGKIELVQQTMFQPLIEEFRHLPFQATKAQLAGVAPQLWSDAASMLFRKQVENRPLVAQVVSVQEVSEMDGEQRDPKLAVYLVDTSSEEKDIWIHNIMADFCSELPTQKDTQ